MHYILDIIILAICAFCIWRGVRRGAIRTAFSLLSLIVALFLTFMFASPFTQYIEQLPFGQNMHVSIETALEEKVNEILQLEENETSNTTEDILKAFPVPEFMKKSLFLKSDFVVRNANVAASKAVADALASAYMKVLCTVILFIAFLILLRLVRFLAELVFKLPLLKQLNGLLGAVAGLVNGIVISYLLLSLVATLSALPAFEWIAPAKESSYIFKNIYENNALLSAIL